MILHRYNFSIVLYILSADLEITVQLLVQVDKLVQLIESPVFTCKQDPTPDTRTTNIVSKICDCSCWSLRNTRTCSSVCMGC